MDMIDFAFDCIDSIFYNKVRKTEAMKLLDRYIIAMSEFLGADIKTVLFSEPVANYAKRLSLTWYLHYLRKHPDEVMRSE